MTRTAEDETEVDCDDLMRVVEAALYVSDSPRKSSALGAVKVILAIVGVGLGVWGVLTWGGWR